MSLLDLERRSGLAGAMRVIRSLVPGLLLLAGCDNYPRDVAGTADMVRAQRIVRVGLIASERAAADRPLISAYLERLGRATGASPRFVAGSAEPLLLRLRAGQLDLVIGEIAEDSPWVADVAVIEPLAERDLGGRKVGLSPIARNGENRWVMLLEREARDLKGAR